MIVEHHFADLSRHPKPVSPEWKAAVAEYLEEVGATDLDDPSAPKRKTPRTDAQLRALDGFKRTQARNKAKLEHQEALARLEKGTAVLRQKSERKPVVRSAHKAKTVRPAAVPKRKYAPRTASATSFDKEAAATRRMGIMQTLKSGGKIEYKQQQDCEGGYAEYQTQYTDIRWLKRVKKLDITRIQSIDSGQSYFVLDDFERYDASGKISGYLNNADSKKALMIALLSKQMVCVENIEATVKAGARSVATLASTYGLDVYTVFDSRAVSGWIAIDKPVEKDTQ